MKKQIKVLTAAALLTLGASFSALAAETGTWALEDGEWVCYDEDGDVYENEWCLSNGIEYYVGDDGKLVTSAWVEDGSEYYYVNSAGTKTINDWRLVTPYEDEDAEEEWFYFGSKGKRLSSAKKVINGNTYYFDNEGKMLTGWVDTTSFDEADSITGAVYTDENGARVKSAWVETYAPGVDPEEDDVDEDDMNWYWIGSAGAAKTGKAANINGETYFFGTDGVMLSGWVATTDADATTVVYNEINHSGAAALNTYDAVYYCGDSDDGHAKKNTWIKEYENFNYDLGDSDKDQYWFWIQKDGKVFIPSALTASNAWDLDDGEAPFGSEMSYEAIVNGTEEKKINGEYYVFNEDGEMQSNFVEFGGNLYYYGGSDDGAKKDGSQVIADDAGENYKFYFSTETNGTRGYSDYAAVTGAKSGKLYNNGLLVTAKEYKYEEKFVGGVYYIVNKSGSIQTSQKMYSDDGVDLYDAENTVFNPTEGVLKGSYTTSLE